jgi:hypothetical protein
MKESIVRWLIVAMVVFFVSPARGQLREYHDPIQDALNAGAWREHYQEQARRAAMTPEQRAAEDKAKEDKQVKDEEASATLLHASTYRNWTIKGEKQLAKVVKASSSFVWFHLKDSEDGGALVRDFIGNLPKTEKTYLLGLIKKATKGKYPNKLMGTPSPPARTRPGL